MQFGLQIYDGDDMKTLKLALAAAIIATSASLTPIAANAAWHYDGYAYSSNFCRNGAYWQLVTWNLTGTSCYMPMHGLWGTRTAE